MGDGRKEESEEKECEGWEYLREKRMEGRRGLRGREQRCMCRTLPHVFWSLAASRHVADEQLRGHVRRGT